MQSQIHQISQLFEQTKWTSSDRDPLRNYGKPELPDSMLLPRDMFFFIDELDNMRNQEPPQKKRRERKRRQGETQ
jgi:hypothetical protein